MSYILSDTNSLLVLILVTDFKRSSLPNMSRPQASVRKCWQNVRQEVRALCSELTIMTEIQTEPRTKYLSWPSKNLTMDSTEPIIEELMKETTKQSRKKYLSTPKREHKPRSKDYQFEDRRSGLFTNPLIGSDVRSSTVHYPKPDGDHGALSRVGFTYGTPRGELFSKTTNKRYTRLAEVPTTKTVLLDLPPELLDHVLSYLPLSSNVCLILSCKGICQLYSSFCSPVVYTVPADK